MRTLTPIVPSFVRIISFARIIAIAANSRIAASHKPDHARRHRSILRSGT
jgi:hypothetical protein